MNLKRKLMLVGMTMLPLLVFNSAEEESVKTIGINRERRKRWL
jgi:hypothetical protein